MAEKRKSIVGAILSGHDGRRGFVHHLVVLPEVRRQGIGQQLVVSVWKSKKWPVLKNVTSSYVETTRAVSDFGKTLDGKNVWS